jgi:hypothetical protein
MQDMDRKPFICVATPDHARSVFSTGVRSPAVRLWSLNDA